MKGKDDSGNLTAEWTYTPQANVTVMINSLWSSLMMLVLVKNRSSLSILLVSMTSHL